MEKEYAEYLAKKTREDYNLIADDFSRTRWNIWSEFNIFRESIKEGDKVLDVGCGNGRLLEILKDKNVRYAGVDISERLIEIAQERYPQYNFLVADNLNLPFLDNNFDKVFSVATLHTIPSEDLRRKAVSELKRVLRPGGLLFVTVWDMWRKDTFFSLLKHSLFKLIGKSKLDFGDAFISWSSKTKRFYHFFTEKGLRSLVENAGFNILKKGIAINETGRRSNIYLIAEK
jgi:ubiquinone/menaquinone biosynthesis C-methylase UbiE